MDLLILSHRGHDVHPNVIVSVSLNLWLLAEVIIVSLIISIPEMDPEVFIRLRPGRTKPSILFPSCQAASYH